MINEKNHVQIELANGNWMRIDPIAPHTFRVRMGDSSSFVEPALIRYGIMRYPECPCDFTVNQSVDSISILTEHAILQINKSDGQLCLSNEKEQVLVQTSGPPWSGRSAGFGIRFTLTAEEKLYGLGNVGPKHLQRRGIKADMCVASESASPIPFLMSSHGWAILIGTTWKHTFDIGSSSFDQMSIEGMGGELDFYLFTGNGFGELLDRYTDIAGKPRLLPIWAYGLTYLRDIQTNDREVMDDILKFRQEGIPCDLISLSRGWTELDDDFSTSKRWHPQRFSSLPNHLKNQSFNFIDMLRRHGYRLGLLLHCSYDLTLYEEQLLDGGNGEVGQVDEAWYDHLQKFVEEGVTAFRFSSASHMIPNPNHRWANGMSDHELNNLYPILLGKQMHSGYANQTGNRPMVHTTAGYTGIQQYAAIESGKYVSRDAAVLPTLNLGLSGHVHTSTHINIDSPEGIHSGFLQAWSQTNSGSLFRNPCFLEKAQRELFRRYAQLRYQLLPYLYSTAHVATHTGMPITRAMPLMFPDDPQCAELHQQYMLGDFLLVAVFTNQIYLPAGIWMDYWTGESYTGPTHVTYSIPTGAGGPLFVRGGAIIPMYPKVDYIDKSMAERMTLHIYPKENAEFTLYEDDGTTFEYLQGKFAATQIRCEVKASRMILEVSRRSGSYEGMPVRDKVDLVIYTGTKPTKILLNNELWSEQRSRVKGNQLASGWRYDRLAGAVMVNAQAVSVEETTTLRIEITCAKSTERSVGSKKGLPSGGKEKPIQADAEKNLRIGLETGKPEIINSALEAWWNARREEDSTASENWRLHLLNGCMLIIHHAERRGWTAVDVFGSDMRSVYMLQKIPSPEQGYELLQRFVQLIVQYARQITKPSLHPVVLEIVDIVEKELDKKLLLHELAERTRIHPFYLSRLFKQETGLSFSNYVLKHRMVRAKILLESGMKVYEAAVMSGFMDANHFSRAFSKYWGVPPKSFK